MRFLAPFNVMPPIILMAVMVGCSPLPERTAQTPAPNMQYPTPQAPVPRSATSVEPQGEWLDWAITPGTWAYRQDERGSVALFGVADGNALVTLRCDKQKGRIYLARASTLDAAKMTLRTSALARSYAAGSTRGAIPYLAIEMMPNDAMLDALAYSRGRFALQTEGQMSLAIPVYAEIGRIVEDCR